MRDPLSEILGPDYDERVNDHESLTNLNRTSAGMDLIMSRAAERLVNKDCGNFRAEVGKLIQEVSRLHSEMTIARGQKKEDAMYKFALQLSKKIDQMKSYCDKSIEDLQAERTFVDIVERVAKQSAEAWRIKLNAANVLSANEVGRVMQNIATILVDSLPRDAAQKVVERIRVEVFQNKLVEGRDADIG